MKTNRIPVYAILLLCMLAGSAQFLLAQAPAEEAGSDEDKGQSAARRFALFLEAGGGAMSMDNLEANIRNNGTFNSTSLISFSDFTYGQATIGWQLPHDKGRFEATYNGHREDTYSMTATGQWASLTSDSDIGSAALPLVPWWTMEISNGTLHSEMFLPTWFADVNDTDGDSEVDPNEIIYSGSPVVVIDNPAQTDMQNSVQTYDVQYRRWFGGRRYGGTWSAGMRYLEYGGNVPATFWISNDNNQFGWTSGGFQNPLIFTQETTGVGPTASLGFEIKYFRDRLQLFGEARLSFLFQSMQTDSGGFFTLLQDPGGGGSSLLSIPAEVSSEFDKDVWNVSAEAGVRVQLLSGLFFEVAYTTNAYHDVVLLPTQLTIPDVLARIGQPVGGVFRSQDLVYEGVKSTLSFQF
ncbi:MAG: hypothetical protein IFK94_07155 [Acidobacteria bacterium]|uniref:Uncharacterized protein n=1 Tax=Candidatus Polarisedimenticola svalbardensis TaxID=2886004 RepID=A0A8J6Y0D3_9BACT|nr:hypothetical protein [Candidatus Polarisedimenticola svalbardensis]